MVDLFKLGLDAKRAEQLKAAGKIKTPDAAPVVCDKPALVWPVIATKDRVPWLGRQLKILRPQLKPGERIIVVNDGGRTVTRHASDTVQVVTLAESVGPCLARRIGNALVPSDAVVCEIDDHDLAEPDLLAELRAAFADPKADVAGCDVWHSDPEGKVKVLKEKKRGAFKDVGNSLGWGLRAYRKWCYDAVGGYPQEYFPANDYALMCMLEQLNAAGVRHIHKPLVTVIEDHTGISAQHKDAQHRQVNRVAMIAQRQGFVLPFVDLGAPGPEPRVAPTVKSRRDIPKLLHFVWVGPDMPDYAKHNIAEFRRLNPGWLVMTHGEDVLMPKWRPGYDAITGEHEWARKSDLLRLSALRKFGGWYFDCDFLPFRPLADVYADYGDFPAGCFLTQGTPSLVANGVIGTSINSEFLGLLDAEVTRLAGEPVNRHWGAFGPALYTALADANQGLVQIGTQCMFYPLQDRDHSRAAWVALRDGADPRAMFGTPLPYMLHMSQQDELTV